MVESFKTKQAKRKKTRKEETEEQLPHGMSRKDKQKLKALDEFVDGVLQEAGEEFLEEFKQVEGE